MSAPVPGWSQVHVRPQAGQKPHAAEVRAAARLLVQAGVLELWRDDQDRLMLLPHPKGSRALARRIYRVRRRRGIAPGAATPAENGVTGGASLA